MKDFWTTDNWEDKIILLQSLADAQSKLLELDEAVSQLRNEKWSYLKQLKDLGLKAADLENTDQYIPKQS